jgi:centromere protein S
VNRNEEVNPEFITAFTNLLSSHISKSSKSFAICANVFVLEITSRDLESFSKHSKRSVINADDVKLLARRNEDLEAKICEFVKTFKKEKD